MIIDGESEILSDVEVILPREVMETCRDLQQGGTSCFLSVNKQDCTTSQLVIHKLHDDSTKIRITVMSLGLHSDENKQVDQVCDATSDSKPEDMSVDASEDTSYENETPDSAVNKRRSFRGKPRVPTAVDSSRLNKHLTNIWSSKRKKTTRKSIPLDSTLISGSDLLLESEGQLSDSAADQASTVIIVKTLPKKEDESSHSPAKLQKVSEGIDKSEVQKGSRDIAERLKARKQRFTASLTSSSVDASMNASGQVTCELCAETVDDYVALVQHVCQQHEDCTYVRNYLDEIQPIADALSAVSLACKACGRIFAGQAALAAHRHECSAVSKPERVSKLGAQRKRVTAGLLSPSQHASDQATHSQQNGAAKPARKSAAAKRGRVHKCTTCNQTFTSEDNLAKHVSSVHNQKGLKRAGGKPSAAGGRSKSVIPPGTKFQQPSNCSELSGSSAGKFQRCDHCNACFSRTSLLVTHMKYCLKANN